MNNIPTSNIDYLSQYRSDMEKQLVGQAQDLLRRYLPPSNPVPSTVSGSSGEIITIPVSALEHAENAPVDAFRTFIYPNLAGNEIYVKKMSDDGNAVTTIYLPKGTEQSKAFDEITKKIFATMSYIDQRMKAIEDKFIHVTKPVNNIQQNPTAEANPNDE